eukprot:477358-Rhodomonas_salina.1
MAALVGGMAVGWAVCEVSKTADARVRLTMAGGALLGGLALQYAAQCASKWISGRHKKGAPSAQTQQGKITYAKSQFEAPEDGPPRVIVAATGSVATVKVPEIVAELLEALGTGTQ